MNRRAAISQASLLPAFVIIVSILAGALFWFSAVRENDDRLWALRDCADLNCTDLNCTGDEWRTAFERCEGRPR